MSMTQAILSRPESEFVIVAALAAVLFSAVALYAFGYRHGSRDTERAARRAWEWDNGETWVE